MSITTLRLAFDALEFRRIHTRLLTGKSRLSKIYLFASTTIAQKNNISLSRDRVSAFASGLAVATQLLLGCTFPCFSPKITKENYEDIHEISFELLKNKLALRWGQKEKILGSLR